MAFKQTKASAVSLDSPEALFRDLAGRKLPNLLTQQSDIIRAYLDGPNDLPDVAYQLPTGGGKTLIGLLISEWRRRKFNERVVYLCPTRQLVNQVVLKAASDYGFTPTAFTGSGSNYDQAAKSDYISGASVAVTTYSSLFNTNPFFADPNLIVLDDVHAAEEYIVRPWTLRINYRDSAHRPLFDTLVGVLSPHLPSTDAARLREAEKTLWDKTWTDKLPTPVLNLIAPELVAAIDAHADESDLRYSWAFVRDHLLACHVYLASSEILIRPLLPPTSMHAPFTNATQRLYMSATLGEGGELERISGRKSIHRLATPQGWEKQSVGRRLFFFPIRGLDEQKTMDLAAEMIQVAGRSLVITSDETRAKKIERSLTASLSFPMFTAHDIEESPAAFLSEKNAIVVVANRYEGIDFAGDECRLLLLDNVSQVSNLQERFLSSRMGAGALLSDRVLTRVQQAFGRCTRSDTDFSAVVILGEEISWYLAKSGPRKHLIPEVQAELEFGFENSNVSPAEMVENLKIFLTQGEDWKSANDAILEARATKLQETLSGTDNFRSVVNAEIDYQHALWRHDFPEALARCRDIVGRLTDPQLQGYRALWNYLAGSAALLASMHGHGDYSSMAREYFDRAQKATNTLPWLNSLRNFAVDGAGEAKDTPSNIVWIERLEVVLEELGMVSDRSYSKEEAYIREQLNAPEAKAFEDAHMRLGRLLGYDAGKEETRGSPDPWWIASPDLCIVFEDHAGAQKSSQLDVTKARQATTHPNWVKERKLVSADATIIPVLITPVLLAEREALPHLENVALWRLDDFRAWADKALIAVRDLRRTFVGPGDVDWRALAVDRYTRDGLDPLSLVRMLQKQNAKDGLAQSSER